jgi:2-polyprenyl-6-methoxyphenol hydroxylase-like FAD-dependent oxidoreductase
MSTANADLVGVTARAYGPLTAKMANLAINDGNCLATMLNQSFSRKHVWKEHVLKEWQTLHRSKFDVTRIRTSPPGAVLAKVLKDNEVLLEVLF